MPLTYLFLIFAWTASSGLRPKAPLLSKAQCKVTGSINYGISICLTNWPKGPLKKRKPHKLKRAVYLCFQGCKLRHTKWFHLFIHRGEFKGSENKLTKETVWQRNKSLQIESQPKNRKKRKSRTPVNTFNFGTIWNWWRQSKHWSVTFMKLLCTYFLTKLKVGDLRKILAKDSTPRLNLLYLHCSIVDSFLCGSAIVEMVAGCYSSIRTLFNFSHTALFFWNTQFSLSELSILETATLSILLQGEGCCQVEKKS